MAVFARAAARACPFGVHPSCEARWVEAHIAHVGAEEIIGEPLTQWGTVFSGTAGSAESVLRSPHGTHERGVLGFRKTRFPAVAW